MPDTVLGTRNTPVNKSVKVPALMGLAWNLGRYRQGINKHN